MASTDEVTVIGPELPPETDKADGLSHLVLPHWFRYLVISVATVYKYLREGLREKKKKAKKEKDEKYRHKVWVGSSFHDY